MKTEEQIQEEIDRHKQHLKKIQFTGTKNEKWLHECIIEGLEWVLKEETNEKKTR